MLRLMAQELPFAGKLDRSCARVKIAIQGECGSFSHQAALQFDRDATIVPCALSRDVFERVVRGEVEAIAIPIENTLAGAVVEHYDLLREQPVHIVRETVVRIQHHVIGVPGSKLSDIRRVYSHPVALAQCREFFREHAEIEARSFYDTAGAVKQVLEGQERDAAGIAGMQAATIYGGEVLVPSVEDDAANYTRFLLVRAGARTTTVEGAQKVSVCLEVAHQIGAMALVLGAVNELEGNVTNLQPRPAHGRPWEYHFFLDVLLPHAAAAQRLLERLPALTTMHKVLGCFPVAPEFLSAAAGLRES